MPKHGERRPATTPGGATNDQHTGHSLSDYADTARREARSFFEGQRIARRALLSGADPLATLRAATLEAIANAIPAQWEQRATVLDDARPRPGEFVGAASAADLDALDRRLAADAARCRLHAATLRGDDLLAPKHAADLELAGVLA